MTPAQKGKITKALNTVKKLGGGYESDIVPIGKGRTKYMRDNNLPAYMRGIYLPGGAKVNKNVQYVAGGIYYERGGAKRERHELNTALDDRALIESAKQILKGRKNRTTSITAAGRVIGSAQGMRDNATIIKEAVYIFNKYAQMADKGETRTRKYASGAEYQAKAAHPSTWGMGVLFESKPPKAAEKRSTKKKARK